MEQKRTNNLKTNIFFQMAYEILALILPIFTSPYIARVIGAEGIGIYSYSYTIASYFVLFADLGIKNYANRLVAQKRDCQAELNRTFTSVFWAHTMVGVIALCVYVIYVLNVSQGQVYAAIQAILIVGCIFDISWLYFGLERFQLTAGRSCIIKVITVFCVFLFVNSKEDLWKYCVIMAMSTLLSQLFLWLPLKKYVRFVHVSKSDVLGHFKPLIILFAPAIAVSIYKYMDKIMIGWLSTKNQLGFYENAEKISNIPLMSISAIGTVMLPRMSNLVAHENDDIIKKYIKNSAEVILCFALAFSCGLAAVAPVFSTVFWGEEFAPAGDFVAGLALTIPFISLANILRTQYLIPKSQDIKYTISVLSGAALNLIINATLIPRYGAYGAVVGTIAAEVSVCLIQCVSVSKELSTIEILKSVWIYTIFGLFMFISVRNAGTYLGTSIRTLLVQVVLGAVIYLIPCIVYAFLKRNAIYSVIIHNLRSITMKWRKK